jgi:large subunit ribosomal protein L5
MGLDDVSVFTEIDLDKVKYQLGINITMVTTAKTNEEAFDLLKLLEMPFAE